METILLSMLLVPLVAFLWVIADLIFAWPLMWAWNYTLPALFKLPGISYWQAFCLLVISSLLIKSQNTSSSSKKG